jgi:predicted glycosyltransferase
MVYSVENQRSSKRTLTAKGFQAMDVEMALELEVMQKMLAGEIGAFSLRYLFISHYINHIGCGAVRDAKTIVTPPKESKIEIIRGILRKKKVNEADILFVSRNRFVEIKTESGTSNDDYIFYRVIAQLKKRFPDLRVSTLFLDDGYGKIEHNKYEHATITDVVRSVFFSLKTAMVWKYYQRSILKSINAQGADEISLSSQSFFQFRVLLRYAILGCSLRNLLNAMKPRVVVSNDDCIYTRLGTDIDYKSLIVQSASVLEPIERCKALIFHNSKLRPDLFLCSGRMSEDIKRRMGSARKVVVTGQLRYDVLFSPSEHYSKEDFMRRYGIDLSNRIVLWTTQTHGLSQEENLKNLKAICEAMNELKGITLVIKQHPAESKAHTHLINEFIGRYGINAILTPKNSDTYEQLFACDLMITRHSTTAIEALVLKKPVIILNLSGEPDPVDYVREGVAAGVYDENSLRKMIVRLLKDDRVLMNNRDLYLDRHLFKIDGKATDRVVDSIIQMIDA